MYFLNNIYIIYENTNTDVDIVTDKVLKTRYTDYDYVNKKLVIRDDSITELYYIDRATPTLEAGIITVSSKI